MMRVLACGLSHGLENLGALFRFMRYVGKRSINRQGAFSECSRQHYLSVFRDVALYVVQVRRNPHSLMQNAHNLDTVIIKGEIRCFPQVLSS